MKLITEKYEKKQNRSNLVLEGAPYYYLNLIRRTAIAWVPTLAVDTVEFRTNTTALYDEIIAHRLGLIPIKTDLKSYVLKEGCSCEGNGCASCELKIIIKGNKKGYLLSGEAKSQDSKCNFVYDMPIALLLNKQKIEAEMTAVLGRGNDHMKWSPCWAFMREIPSVKIDSDADKKLASKYPSIFTSKGGKLALKEDALISIPSPSFLSELEGITVDMDTGKYLLVIESFGQLSIKEVLVRSTEVINDKLEDIKKPFA